MNDPVRDMLIRIKNAYLAKHENLVLPYFGFGEKIAKILSENGYVGVVKVEEEKDKKRKGLQIELIYKKKKPVLTELKIISKQEVKVYSKAKELKGVMGGLGISLISTPAGLMTGKEAKKRNLGGELICEVW